MCLMLTLNDVHRKLRRRSMYLKFAFNRTSTEEAQSCSPSIAGLHRRIFLRYTRIV